MSETKIDYISEKVDGIAESVHHIDTRLALSQQALTDHMSHDEKNDAEILVQLKEMNLHMGEVKLDVAHHIARTDELQEFVKKIDERLSPLELDKIRAAAAAQTKLEMAAQSKEIRTKVFKVLGLLATIATAIGTILAVHK